MNSGAGEVRNCLTSSLTECKKSSYLVSERGRFQTWEKLYNLTEPQSPWGQSCVDTFRNPGMCT